MGTKNQKFSASVGKVTKKVFKLSKKGVDKTLELPGKTVEFTKESAKSIKDGFQNS